MAAAMAGQQEPDSDDEIEAVPEKKVGTGKGPNVEDMDHGNDDDEDDEDEEDEEDEDEDEEDEVDEIPSAAEWKARGDTCYKTGDYRGAVAEYSKGIDFWSPQALRTSSTRAAAARAAKGSRGSSAAAAPPSTPPPSAEETKAAMEVEGGVVNLLGNRAAARMMLLQYDQVVADCDRAMEIDQNYAKGAWRKADALKKRGLFSESVRAYQHGMVLDPNNAVQMKERAEAEQCAKKVERAKELLSAHKFSLANSLIASVLQVAPSSREVKLLKVDGLVGLKKFEEAYALTTPLFRMDTQSPPLLLARAKCLYGMANLESCIKHLQEAARQDPDAPEVGTLIKRAKSMEVLKAKGNQAFKAAQYEAAIEAWTEAVQVDPSNQLFNAKLFSNRATANSKLRRQEKAVEDATLAIEADKTFAKAYRTRATALMAIGGEDHIPKAIQDFEKLASMSPEADQRGIREQIRSAQMALKQAKRKDFYKILGVQRGATADEIKKAYRKQALKFHPDKQAGKSDAETEAAGKSFREIGEAYEVLSDVQKKDRYDSGVDIEDLDNPHAGHGPSGMHMDPNVLFQMFGGMGGMGGMGGGGGRGGRRGGGGGGGGGPGMHFHYG